MSTMYLPTVEEVDALIHGCAEKGVYDAIARGVADALRDALPPLGARLAAAHARRAVESPEFRTELALDALARLGRPVIEADHEALTDAMSAAGGAAVYALAEEALDAVGGH